MSEYHWPHPESVKRINKLLNIPATGIEQDWEIEFGTPEVVSEAIALFKSEELDLDDRSALMLLILAGIEEADSQGRLDARDVDTVREILSAEDVIKSRMQSYWLGRGFLDEQPSSPLHRILV